MKCPARVTLICILGFIEAGCAKTAIFRAIDASTNQPLSGVTVAQQNLRVQGRGPGTNAFYRYTMGADGRVKVRDLDCNMNVGFRFTLDGYQPTVAVFECTPDGFVIIAPAPPAGVIVNPPTFFERLAEPVNIPMYPIPKLGSDQ